MEFEGDDVRPLIDRRSTNEFVRPENFFDPPSEEEMASVTAHVAEALQPREEDDEEVGREDEGAGDVSADEGASEQASAPEASEQGDEESDAGEE